MVGSHDELTIPLWREPAFKKTLWWAGAAALVAALGGSGHATGLATWVGGLVLPALLGAAYVGAVGAGWGPRLWEAARFGCVAIVLPLLIGDLLRTSGLAPAPNWLGWLAASGALLSMPAVACLEGAPAPSFEDRGPATGRAPLFAAAIFTLALAAALQTETARCGARLRSRGRGVRRDGGLDRRRRAGSAPLPLVPGAARRSRRTLVVRGRWHGRGRAGVVLSRLRGSRPH